MNIFMPDQKLLPKIPIKKADGTTVFLTMDEFREYKKKSAAPNSGAVSSVPNPVKIESKSPVATLVPPENISFDAPVPKPVATLSVPRTEKAVQPVVKSTPKPDIQKSLPKLQPPKKLEQGKVVKIDEVPLPMVQNTKTELANVTPVKDVFVEEPKQMKVENVPPAKEQPVVESKPVEVVPPPLAKPEWKESDHASLLEEDIAQEKKILPAPSSAKSADNALNILETVKTQFPFPISKDVEGRFDSLVLSRIRDIRAPLEVEQYAKMSKDQGGLGMEEDQVSMLLAVIAAAQKISTPVAPSSQPQPSLPKSASGPRITPVMNAPSASVPPQTPPTPRIPIPIEPPEYSFNPAPKPNQTGASKTMMQDVAPPERRRTMGPVDELQFFSLVDFRRLSPKTENSKEILKGKFQALQEESYVLFLDARDAWHQSPLFKVYQDTILSALTNKWTLQSAISQNQNGLTPEEVSAIVEINHYLG